MPGADVYRAIATAKFIRDELMHEREAHDAMKLCFEKIHKSLDMYKGHYINRLRFHLNRHHTEYLRKVRVMKHERRQKEEAEDETKKKKTSARRSMRVGVAQELEEEVKMLKLQLRRKDMEIDRLTMLIDDKSIELLPPVVTTQARKKIRIPRMEKLMNPYMPSSSDDEPPASSAAAGAN
jgi:hypothetical protein